MKISFRTKASASDGTQESPQTNEKTRKPRRPQSRLKRYLKALGIVIAALGVLGTILLLYLLHGTQAALRFEEVVGPHPMIAEANSELVTPYNVPSVVGWQGAAQPRPSAGLQVELFAKDLDNPRGLLVLPNGDVLVSESTAPAQSASSVQAWLTQLFLHRDASNGVSPDKILLLRTGQDKAARFDYLTGLHSPSGMALLGDTLYVADSDALLAFPYHAGETHISATPRKVVDLPSNAPNLNWVRNVIVGEDGKHLYVSIGSATNIGQGGMAQERGRAAILQIDPQTGEKTILSGGMRNPMGMAYDPVHKSIWATVQERSGLGADTPPDYLTRVELGSDYGWPENYWGGYQDPRVDQSSVDKFRQSEVRRPEYALGAHTGAAGISFAHGDGLGLGYGAFIALSGSWNRRPVAGYTLLFVPFEETGFPYKITGYSRAAKGQLPDPVYQWRKPIVVLDGFLNADGAAQGRPVDVKLDAAGALLVSDDIGGRIWRVRKK
jgi:glucose/arabinose dehydrogenase